MFALSGPSDFHGAPVTKFLMCYAFVTYFLFMFPLQHFHHLFQYNQDVFARRQFKRMILSKLVYLDLADLIFTSVIIYNFRMFERRFGSRKFVSHILATLLLGSFLELIIFGVLNRLDIRLEKMPSGLYSLVFPLYVPFYCTVPRVAIMSFFGVPVTGKTVNYILGLQMASSSLENLLVTSCALLSGVLWRKNFLKVQNFLQVPKLVAKQFDYCFGRLLESSISKSLTLPMGATLELQQREKLDRLEQQLMMSAIHASRQMEIGRPQVLSSSQLNRGQRSDATGSQNLADFSVSEDQVHHLMAMGFSDEQSRQALRATNNNTALAINFLLQNM